MRRERGFTLLEVLVALVLIGLLMVVLFGGFRAGIRSWQLAESHTTEIEDRRQLSGLLYRHLGQLRFAVPVISESGQLSSFYLWEPSRLRYVAPLAMSTGGMPYVFELVSDAPGMPGIWVRFAPFDAQQPVEQAFAGVEFQQVSSDVRLLFHYFTRSFDQGDVPREWRELSGLDDETPSLVAVRFVGDDSGWPDLVLPVHMTEVPDE